MRRIRQPLQSLIRYNVAGLYRRSLELLLRDDGRALLAYRKSAGRIPTLRSVDVQEDDGLILLSTKAEELYFPSSGLVDPVLKSAVILMSLGYLPWLRNKYTMRGFVEVEPQDVVVDCGAFVGGFALSVKSIASQVYAIEPAPRSYQALKRNTQSAENVQCANIGFYDRQGVLPMNISSTAVDNSLLTVDAGETVERVDVRLERLDAWARSNGINEIDFLKLEAEGVEPEIAGSIGGLRVRKIAADCGPERDAEATGPAVISALESRGFECRADGRMVFARSPI